MHPPGSKNGPKTYDFVTPPLAGYIIAKSTLELTQSWL